MALTPAYNLVTFDVGGEGFARLYLTGSSLTRRGGLEPDVWTFTAPYTELDKIVGLHDADTETPGNLELWYTYHPDSEEAPDVLLVNVAIVCIDADLIGREPGDTVDKVLSYKITIADHRRGFVEPRGGRLFDGLLNPDPLPDGGSLISNKDLMLKCADAMGVSLTVPTSVNDAEPMRDVDWGFAHAPGSLQELVEHTGHVYAPLISGAAQIMKPGTGGAVLPGDRLIRDVTHKSIDTRPVYAVFSSAPNAVVYTFDKDGESLPTWKYVVQDPEDDQWKPVDEVAAIVDAGGAGGCWTDQFENVAEEHRSRIREQLYCCIQLDPESYPPGRAAILPKWIDLTLRQGQPGLFNVSSTLAIQLPDGTYARKNSTIPLLARQVVPEHNVMIFPHPLVTLTGTEATQLTAENSTPLAEASLKPNFSAEAFVDGKRHYAAYGFANTGGGGGLITLTEEQAREQLTGFRPSTAILCSPDLVQVVLNPGSGSTTNRDDMEARAETYAASVIRLDELPLREMTFKGFLQVELSGQINQIDYDIEAVTTLVTVNGWHVASKCAGDDAGMGSGGESGITRNVGRQRSRSRHASRRRAQRKSTLLGTDGAAKAVELSRPLVREPAFPQLYVAAISSAVSGQKGRYNGTYIEWKPNASATGNLTAANIGTTGADCLIWHPSDITKSEPTLSAGDVVWCGLGPTDTTSGKRILISLGSGGAAPDPFELPTASAAYQVLMWNGSAVVWDFPRIHS